MSEYKFTFWNRDKWYHSDCWANLDKTCEKFPQCVDKGVELGKALIEADKKSREWDRNHPDEFKSFNVDMPSHIGRTGTLQQEDCVETFIAYQIYYQWFQGTDAWRKAMDGTQKQIAAYFRSLAENETARIDTLDAEKDAYWHKRLNEKIEQAEKLI